MHSNCRERAARTLARSERSRTCFAETPSAVFAGPEEMGEIRVILIVGANDEPASRPTEE